jgi:hypothetical protein
MLVIIQSEEMVTHEETSGADLAPHHLSGSGPNPSI